jgi:hypothetical protein
MNGQKLKRGHLEVWKQSQMSICKNKHKLKNVNILNAINKPISSNCLIFWEKQTNSALKGGSIFWCTYIIRTFSSDNEPQKKEKNTQRHQMQFAHFVSLPKNIVRQDDELLNYAFHLQPIHLLPKTLIFFIF